jgi:DnaJ family protein A protein 2
MFNGSVDELFSSLFGMGGMGGMHGMPGMGGMGGMPFGPNIRVFQNGVPVNIHQGFGQGFQKPTPIIKTINVAIDKILTGTTIPVDIERWIIDSGNKIFENETIYITIPKGIDDGEIIVIGEKGNVANETCKGDIKIFIKVENNTEFQRSGLDLILQKCITLKEALCGFTFDLKYLTGKIFTITNNSGNIISHGYKKIIPNMGFTREGHTGNLLIVFDVKFPEKMSNETIESLKNIDF